MFDENCYFSRGAPAARAPFAREARPPTAPSGQGGPGRMQEQTLHPLPSVGGGLWPCVRVALVPPVGRGGSSSAPEQRALPLPPDTFLESTYPEMQRKHIPRVNEYQS